MRKQNKTKTLADGPINNPVAKYAGRFNKARIFADKSKYSRKNKHAGMEPFPITLAAA